MKNILLLLIFCLLSSNAISQKSFSFKSFKNTKNLKLLGDATLIPGGVRLTAASPYQRGAFWYKKKMSVIKSFTAQFKMRMSKADIERGGADGIAFVIQNDPRKLGLGQFGEGMGYSGLANCIVIEFDTYDNDEGSDNHVSIQTNGKGMVSRFSRHTRGINHNIPILKNRIRTVKITYNKNLLKVYIDGKFALKTVINLKKELKLGAGKAYVGFTSATAKAFAQQEIIEWKWECVDVPIANHPTPEVAPQTSWLASAIVRRKNWV